MKYKEIVVKLLDHYKIKLAEAINLDKNEFFKFIRNAKIDCGVCICAWHIFNTNICKDEWVKKYCINNNIYWGKMPYLNNNKEEAITCIQLRIDNLEKELTEINK